MARLPRLFIAGHPQLFRLQTVAGLKAFETREHYEYFLVLLGQHARLSGIAIYAYALLPETVLVLCGVPNVQAIGRCIQGVNRFFVPWRLRGGSLWQPRFKSTVVQSGMWALRAALWVDYAPVQFGFCSDPAIYQFCSYAGHVGGEINKHLTELPAYFALGNTPFDRQMAYRYLVEQGIGETARQRLYDGLLKGWAVMDHQYIQAHWLGASRPLQPRARGRPIKSK